MPDPSHHYGWRDFSERSSFGNLREWGYCAIAYTPTFEVGLDGVERMREFGIDIEKITEEDLRHWKSSIYGRKLQKDIRSTFYHMEEERIKGLARKYKIDYIVMNKKYQKAELSAFNLAYENEDFIVYSVFEGVGGQMKADAMNRKYAL
jgi:hypothetical protein